MPELYRVRALAHHALGALDAAVADLAEACDLARAQGATTLLRRAEESRRALSCSTH